jgi:hypothetical protein
VLLHHLLYLLLHGFRLGVAIRLVLARLGQLLKDLPDVLALTLQGCLTRFGLFQGGYLPRESGQVFTGHALDVDALQAVVLGQTAQQRDLFQLHQFDLEQVFFVKEFQLGCGYVLVGRE